MPSLESYHDLPARWRQRYIELLAIMGHIDAFVRVKAEIEAAERRKAKKTDEGTMFKDERK